MNKIPFPLRQQNITYTCFQRPATLAEGGRTATFTYNGDDERVKMNVTDGTGSVLTRYYLGGRYELDVTLGNTREKMYLGCRLMGKLLLKHIIPHTYSIEFMKKHNRIFIYIIFGLLNSCIIPDVGVSCICLRNKTDKPIACYRTDGTFGISYPDIIFPWDDATDVQKLRVNVMDWEYLMCGRARNDYHWFWNTQQNVLSFYTCWMN